MMACQQISRVACQKFRKLLVNTNEHLLIQKTLLSSLKTTVMNILILINGSIILQGDNVSMEIGNEETIQEESVEGEKSDGGRLTQTRKKTAIQILIKKIRRPVSFIDIFHLKKTTYLQVDSVWSPTVMSDFFPGLEK